MNRKNASCFSPASSRRYRLLTVLADDAEGDVRVATGGGTDGGEVVFTGTPRDLLACPTSKTVRWLENSIMKILI